VFLEEGIKTSEVSKAELGDALAKEVHPSGYLAVHVAYLTPGFAVDETDTNCVPAIQDFLLALKQLACDVQPTVFSLRYPHRRERYRWHGMDVVPADGQTLRFPAVASSWARLAAAVQRTRRHHPIDLIHSFWLGECALLGEFLSRCYRIPHIVTLMDARRSSPSADFSAAACSPGTRAMSIT
jgi:hypothetical protein